VAISYFVGIDVSKDTLDVCVLPTGESFRVSNDEAGIKELRRKLQPLAPERVVMEATGGLEAEASLTLRLAGLNTCVVNPLWVKNFAKADGQLAKSDNIDAGVIAKYGERMLPEVRELASDDVRELDALVTRRRQLVQMSTAEKNRKGSSPRALRPGIQMHIDWMSEEMERIEKEMDAVIKKSAGWKETVDLYMSAPGVGIKTAYSLIAEAPELDRISAKQISALVGVAPYPRDSGKFKGQRRIRGGRASLRCMLYMATLSAIKWNPVIKAHYTQLIARGKLFKVAMVACMRKLLVILSAMARSRTPWNSDFATTA
jgi:transposase